MIGFGYNSLEKLHIPVQLDLRSGNLNVTQVLCQVGMRNFSCFAKSFKKYYGVNPGEYQNRP